MKALKNLKDIFFLLQPRILGFNNRLKRIPGTRWKFLFFISISLGFWSGIFYASFRILSYFNSIPGFGEVLSQKVLSMILLTFFTLLIYSHVITALSNFFLSKDLSLLHETPVPRLTLFSARYFEILFDASWMVILMGMPIFLGYGITFQASVGFYLSLPLILVPFVFLAGSLGIVITLLLTAFLPVRRTRDLLVILGILMVAMLFMVFRLLRPEQLVNPDQLSTLVEYLGSLTAQESPYLPSSWAKEAFWSFLKGNFFAGLLPLLVLWSTAWFAFTTNLTLAWLYYFSSYSRAQEGTYKGGQVKNRFDTRLWQYLPFSSGTTGMILKDMKVFYRDKTQWSQLFILIVLIVIYVYNFSVLPLHKSPLPTLYLKNFIAFLNLGLAGFVLASVAVRFVFPAVSSEGYAFWMIRSAPLSLKNFLWYKFIFYFIPLMILSEVLICFTNRQLQVSSSMQWISSLTMISLDFGLVGLAIGLGAMYPQYGSENLGQMPTGFGGFLYMIFSLVLIGVTISLEAGPVYRLLITQIRSTPFSNWDRGWMISSLGGVLFLHLFTGWWAMKRGLRSLNQTLP
jgi:ABC-2 type transport system permease protein